MNTTWMLAKGKRSIYVSGSLQILKHNLNASVLRNSKLNKGLEAREDCCVSLKLQHRGWALLKAHILVLQGLILELRS